MERNLLPDPVSRVAMSFSRILLVDEDATVRRSLARALRPYAVDVCESAEAALALVAEDGNFDVIVVCDLRPGELTGPELWRALALIRPDAHRRLVFLTADTASRQTLAVLRQPVLEKPSTREQIIEACRLVVEREG